MEVWGPRVVSSVTRGTIQALRVPFKGLLVVVWGPRVVILVKQLSIVDLLDKI